VLANVVVGLIPCWPCTLDAWLVGTREREHGAMRRHALRYLRSRLFSESHKGGPMLYWTAVFFVIALAAAVFGFSGIAAGAAGIAKILFFVFLVLGALSLIFGRRVPA
jgi:uncharacterized membrane protein YtjA (UPF0391 family)